MNLEHCTPIFCHSPSFIFTYPDNFSILVQAVENFEFLMARLRRTLHFDTPNFVLSKPPFMFAYLKNFECQSRVKKSFNFRFLILILIFNFQQYLFGEDPPLWYLQTLSKFIFFLFVFIQKIPLTYLEWLKFLTFGGHV